jgi:hypothetical protein
VHWLVTVEARSHPVPIHRYEIRLFVAGVENLSNITDNVNNKGFWRVVLCLKSIFCGLAAIAEIKSYSLEFLLCYY